MCYIYMHVGYVCVCICVCWSCVITCVYACVLCVIMCVCMMLCVYCGWCVGIARMCNMCICEYVMCVVMYGVSGLRVLYRCSCVFVGL